jgi:hypothetical protein
MDRDALASTQASKRQLKVAIQELMSMEHTRSYIKKLIPVVGDNLFTNKRRPILTIIEVIPSQT